MREVKRIVNRRFFMMLAALLIFNGVVLMSFHMKNKEEAEAYDALIKLTAEHKQDKNTYNDAFPLAWRQYIEENKINKDTVTEAIKSAKEQLPSKIEYIDGYHSMIEEKMKFSQSGLNADFYKAKSFERINLHKTYMDLSKLMDSEVILSNGRWLEVLHEYEYAPVFILLVLIYCVYGFFAERKSGLHFVIHTGVCGRGGLLIKRTVFLFVTAFAVSVLFYLESACILLKIYGGADALLMPAASDEMFFLTAGTLSRLGFALLQTIACALSAFSLALLLWLVLGFFNNVNIGMFAYLLGLGMEVLLYVLIHAKSFLKGFKYVNLYYLLNPGKAIKYYNWGYDFGVVEMRESTLLLLVLLSSLCFLLHVHISTRCYFSGRNNLFERAANCVMSWIMRGIGALPAIFKEMYKVLFSQRAIVVLALLLYMAVRVHVVIAPPDSLSAIRVSQYYDRAAGMGYSEELEAEYGFFEKECEEMAADLDENDSQDQKILINWKSALAEMRRNVDYLKNLKEKGIDAVVLKPYEYNKAFGKLQSDNQAWLALLNILAAIVISAGFVSYEKRCNVYSIALSCPNRRKWLLRKIVVNALLIGAFEAASYAIYYGKLFKAYSIGDFAVPLKSLPMFEKSLINPSIAGFIVIDLLVRFLVLMGLSAFLCRLSRTVKWSYCAAAGLLVTIPQFLYVMGFESMERWSVGRYTAYLPVFNDASQPAAVYYAFIAAVVAGGAMLYGSFMKRGAPR